ncbi:protein SOGA1-like [Scleropages formosus]|uniref:protein SOGA1-like n=1 Tax=Scleropages formosus TaxID=113540 RepID=UPI0010FAB700|nr:protein SOGA1-like [Scleropages formosus]
MDGGSNPEQQPQQAAAGGHAPGHGAPVKKVRVSRRHGKEARPPACAAARGIPLAEPAACARRKVPHHVHVPRVQGKVSSPDSSSEDSGGQSADTRTPGKPDRETLGGGADLGLGGRGVPLTSSDLTGRLGDAQQQEEEEEEEGEQELLRDLEELRSENEYLKDEMEEMRAEMLEMRDAFLKEEEGQLQELRAQLEGARRTCRVLQYRLRKAERHSLRVAHSGQVDRELVGTLEQDVKVARDVSVRLHAELSRAEDHWNRLERENQELREKLLDLEVANQVLKEEVDKARENSLRKRGLRSSTKADRKSSQDDIADLKCQLHFAKEESLLMCKKLTKTAKESEAMREELARYRALYGDVDTPPSGEMTAGSLYTREAEVKVHLRLVEEEANLLSRRIVELEVENRGLQAEMEVLKEKEAGLGADSMRELKKHLQFVEGDVELVQRSMAELQEQNWALKTRLGRSRAELELEPNSNTFSRGDEEPLEGGMQSRAQDGNLPSHIDRRPPPLDGPGAGEQELLVGEERNAQKDCCCPSSLRSTDQETLVAVREQAHLVGTTIRLLLRPGPDSTGPFWPRGLLAGTLASRLEALQVLLLGLLEGEETPGSCGRRQVEGAERESAGTPVPPLCRHHELVKEAAAERKVRGQEAKTNQALRGTGLEAEAEETCTQMLSLRLRHHDSKTLELRQDAQLLILRLRCFLKQWRKGQARDPGRKESLQVGSDLGSTLQDLKGALRDLSAILHKECQGSLEHKQQFHDSKTTWEVDRSELRREVLPDAHPQLDSKDTEADCLNEVLQRGCEEHTRPVVAEPCIPITESFQEQWMCEKMELLDRLCHEQNHLQAKLDAQFLQRKTSERKSSLETEAQETNSQRRNCAVSPQLGNEGFPDSSVDHRAKAEGSRKREDSERYPFFAHTDLGSMSGKNWMYLTEEAGALKGNEPFKTWDCPSWTSTFPDLDLGHGWVRRSCTAPDKSGLRIYYSPPGTRRITPRPTSETGKKEEEMVAKSEEFKSLSNSTESVDSTGTLTITFENWINRLSEQQRDLLENGSASRTSGTGFPLPFEHLEMSGNLSDDMKEMTYSMRQVARPGPLESRLRDAACQTSEEEDTGDPKAPVPLLVSVGLQTEAPSSSTATQNRKSWPPRVSSLGTARVRHISVSLERVPDRSKRSRCGSPKLQRRLVCSSSTSRLDSGRDHLGLWGLPQRDTSAPALTQSTSAQGSPSGPLSSVAEEARTVVSNKAANKAANKASSAHKYGIVQEFFRNVCSRGHAPTLGGRQESMKTMVSPCGDRRVLVEDKKAEHPASRATSLVRSNSFSKIVNKRLTNQSPRDERGGASRAPHTAERTMSGSTLEDVACDCTSQSLTSCFSRSSRSFSHHTPGQCKPRPPEPSITLTTVEKEKLSQD